MKALVESEDSNKFAILGINTDKDADYFRAQCVENGITWDNIFNGDTKGGIPQAWGVSGYPTIYVLDGNGVIRAKGARGERLGVVVKELIAEMEGTGNAGN